jgi:transposase
MVLGSLFRTRCARFPKLLAFPPRFQRPIPLRRLFETMLQRCIDEGLVGGEDFAIDASLIQADASDRTRVEGAAV